MKIGAVSRLLDIPVTTIRFYEEEGILAPERRESGYRDYAMLDVFNLMECIRYRNMGLSVKEVARALHDEEVPYLRDRIGESIGRIREEMAQSHLLLSNLEELSSQLDTLSWNAGRRWAVKVPSRSYVVMGRDTPGAYGQPELSPKVFQAWVSRLPFTYGAYLFQEGEAPAQVLMGEEQVCRGFGLLEEGEVHGLPGQLCLKTIFADERDTPPKEEEIRRAFGEEASSLVPGVFAARLLIRCREGAGPKRYWEVTAPLC